MFEKTMWFITIPTTLLQIFCKIILNSRVRTKSIIVPDDNFPAQIAGMGEDEVRMHSDCYGRLPGHNQIRV